MSKQDMTECSDDGARGAHRSEDRATRGTDAAAQEEFVATLFDGVAPEDVARYDGAELVAFATKAWTFLAARKPSEPKIRLTSETYREGERRNAISILEIINDDMPFLVSSVLAELEERKIAVQLVAHPVLNVTRDDSGRLIAFSPRTSLQSRESFIHFHIDHVEENAERDAVVASLAEVLEEIRRAVTDWRSMLAKVGTLVDELARNPSPLLPGEISEAIAFLQWLVADNFIFLGMRDYKLLDGQHFEPQYDTNLGVLRHREMRVLQRDREPPEILAFLHEPKVLITTKSNVRSRVHRRVYLDYIGIKRLDVSGRVVGEFRIIGLFTSTAYTRPARSIPYLRRKLDTVVRRAAFPAEGHSEKALLNILETYPRDDLFQIDEDELYRFVLAILYLGERPRVRVLPRYDRFDRFVSILVYVPRARYHSSVQIAIGNHLTEVFKGRLAVVQPNYLDGPLVRAHFIIASNADAIPRVSQPALEGAVETIIRTWLDNFVDQLNRAYDPARAHDLARRYGEAFSAAYREAYTPEVAVRDLRVFESVSADRPIAVEFRSHEGEGGEGGAALKVWSFARPIPLSERVPVLENMGFRVVDEQTYHVALAGPDAPDFWLHDMVLRHARSELVEFHALRSKLAAGFLMVMRGIAENDGYNALILRAGLGWRDVALIRTLSRHLRQIRVPFSQDYMWATLTKHAALAEQILALFHARFGPNPPATDAPRTEQEQAITTKIERELAQVESLDEDRILRRFVNAVSAAVRTNFYQLGADGMPRDVISVKFSSHKLDAMPLPRPLYEIFVYSPRVEGIHLRFGKVARGGIRWSDRPQDFRTEILGLGKAQQVKNAVIVPVGAKGGFVPKRLIPTSARALSRAAVQAEGVATYEIFIGALLDLTDNIGVDDIIHPESVIRHDDDDPYLVVAADKGTATFSDIANGIARTRDFWLDDAFASGGSAGYDHKKMGITARGAWEAVNRHFRELNVDIGKTLFTVGGIGDMSGDVFGNAMLRERTIKLVAAFDHRDIFIDPDPDPERSFAERKRLFDLPQSSWQSYNKELVSPGGGVYSRAAKEINLSPQAQALFGLARANITPPELISGILKLPVDLLFFGGIGTYVRASMESDEAAGDRANDAVRITGADLRCKVIGEGANLGMTQRGRIEAAFRGVRLNTDAIDNSAGVNTSDLEVNLKIALSRPMRDRRLTRTDRDQLLVQMAEDVATLVLRANYQQTLALSLALRRGMEDFGFEQRLMQTLEARHLLDRAVEFLPDDVELTERRNRARPLTRPELAVLLAYAKLALKSELLNSSVPDDPYLAREVERYFPPAIAQQFPEAIRTHRLRREIIATQLANSMLNRGGPSLIVRMTDATYAAPDRIAAAFTVVRNSFRLVALNGQIDALDNKIDGEAQLGLYAELQNLLLDRMVWFLRNVDLKQGLAAIIERYHAQIEEVAQALDRILPDELAAIKAARVDGLKEAGVPTELAQRIGDLRALGAATDIVLIASPIEQPVVNVAATYFAASAFFRLQDVAAAAREIRLTDYYDRLAFDRALAQIGEALRALTAHMVDAGTPGRDAVERWAQGRGQDVERTRLALHEVVASGLTLSKLSVAANMLTDLAR
jgi:glutamate dehydrogenase